MSLRADLSLLRERDFRWYFWAQFVNLLGTSMASMALAFAVLRVSDSASALGQVLAARTIPMVVFLLLGGVLADRFPRIVVIQVCNLACAATQGVAAYLVISGHAQVWELAALELVNGTTSALLFPAMQGMVPQLVGRDVLRPANLLMQQAASAIAIVGPAVSGVLIAAVGPGPGLAIDASTWLVSAVMMLGVRRRLSGARTRASVLGDLAEGWTFFRTTTWLWVVVAAFCVLNLIISGATNTLGPAIAVHTIGSHGWGLGRSGLAIGRFVGSLALARLTLRRPLFLGMGLYALGALPILVLGVWVHTAPLVIAFGLYGCVSAVFSLGWRLALQEHVPEEMLSRALSYDALGSFVAMPLGQLAYGSLGDAFGYRPVLIGSAVGFAGVCLATLLSSSVRNLSHDPDPVPDAVEGVPT